MKVERAIEMDSLVWIRVKIWSTMPILAPSAGTKLPMCARNTIRPTCSNQLRATLTPTAEVIPVSVVWQLNCIIFTLDLASQLSVQGDVMYCSCVCCLCIVSRFLEHSDTPYIFLDLSNWMRVSHNSENRTLSLRTASTIVQLLGCLLRWNPEEQYSSLICSLWGLQSIL